MQWAPRWALHAIGSWEAPSPDDEGAPLQIKLVCLVCSQTHHVECLQRMPRMHVQKWALVHLHRNPLVDDPVFGAVGPASK